MPIFKPPLYLDPGSGNLLIQLIAAALLGAGVAVKIFWSRIKALFTGKKDAAEQDDDIRLD